MLKEIISGWGNYIFANEKAETIARSRAVVCSKCEHAKKLKVLEFLEDDVKEIEALACELCSCPLSAKLRSLSSKCDANKW